VSHATWHSEPSRGPRQPPNWKAIDQALTELGEQSHLLPPWLTPAVRSRFGKEPDKSIAQLAGVPSRQVYSWCRRLGVRAAAPMPWQRREIRALLGLLTDKAVAVRAGVGRQAVWEWRKRLGIPARGRGHRLTDARIAQLGTTPDTDIAREASVTVHKVRDARRKLAIAPYRQVGKSRPAWFTAEIEAMLGKKSDSHVATVAGVTKAAIWAWRTHLQVYAFGWRDAPPKDLGNPD